MRDPLASVNDPIRFAKAMWPRVEFYNKQREIIYSVRNADETLVTAGNMLGKDFVTGFVALSFFLRPQMYFDPEYVREVESRRSADNPHPHTVRIITTSAAEKHLMVLWGEIGRFATTARYPVLARRGGPLVINSMEIRYAHEAEAKVPLSYLVGKVSAKREGMSGHHAAYTLAIADESSGVDDEAYDEMTRWCKRFLGIGNPNPCNNFFYRGVKKGDKRYDG